MAEDDDDDDDDEWTWEEKKNKHVSAGKTDFFLGNREETHTTRHDTPPQHEDDNDRVDRVDSRILRVVVYGIRQNDENHLVDQSLVENRRFRGRSQQSRGIGLFDRPGYRSAARGNHRGKPSAERRSGRSACTWSLQRVAVSRKSATSGRSNVDAGERDRTNPRRRRSVGYRRRDVGVVFRRDTDRDRNRRRQRTFLRHGGGLSRRAACKALGVGRVRGGGDRGDRLGRARSRDCVRA